MATRMSFPNPPPQTKEVLLPPSNQQDMGTNFPTDSPKIPHTIVAHAKKQGKGIKRRPQIQNAWGAAFTVAQLNSMEGG